MEKSETKHEIKDTKGRVIATKVSCGGEAKCGEPAEASCCCMAQEKAGPVIEVTEKPVPEKKVPAPRPRVGIMETAFRDAHQSIMATRLRTAVATRTAAANTFGMYFRSASTIAVLPKPQAVSPEATAPVRPAMSTMPAQSFCMSLQPSTLSAKIDF